MVRMDSHSKYIVVLYIVKVCLDPTAGFLPETNNNNDNDNNNNNSNNNNNNNCGTKRAK